MEVTTPYIIKQFFYYYLHCEMRIFHSQQLYHVTTVSSAICKGTLRHQWPTVIGYFTTEQQFQLCQRDLIM